MKAKRKPEESYTSKLQKRLCQQVKPRRRGYVWTDNASVTARDVITDRLGLFRMSADQLAEKTWDDTLLV